MHYFMNNKVLKTFEKAMTLCRFFSLGIGITKVHCIAMASICSVKQQHSNHQFFSAKSTNPTVFRMHILVAFFSAKSADSTVECQSQKTNSCLKSSYYNCVERILSVCNIIYHHYVKYIIIM